MKSNTSKILIVDDNQINLLYITQILREKGYECETALNGREALAFLKEELVDLILLDIMMPEMTGIEVCELLKKSKRTKEIPVIFVTALDDIKSIEDSFEVGGVDYITKPFHQTELLARVNTHLTLRNLIKQIKSSNVELAHEIIDRVKAEKEVAVQKITIEDKQQEVIESENKYKTMLESMHDGVFITLNEEVIYQNAAMNFILDGDENCQDFIFGNEETRDWCLEKVSEEGKHLVETYNEEEEKYFQISISEVKFQSHEKAHLHIVRDITESKLAQQKIQEHQEKFEHIFNNSNDAILICSPDGIIKNCNRESLSLFTRSINQLVGVKIDSFFQYTLESLKNQWSVLERGGKFLHETELNHSETKRKYVELSAKRIDFKGKEHVLCICRDITERKELQRNLINTVIQTEEKERNRFAKDLHDGIGPLLSTSLLYLNALDSDCKDQAVGETIHKIYDSVNESIHTIKEISNNISPRILKNKGLIPAIETFCKKAANAKEIEFDFRADKEKVFLLPENVEISLYRISIELINNTIKYAEATHFNISIHKEADVIEYWYADDGKGFDLEKVLSDQKGMGLQNIKSRIDSLHGNIEFKSKLNEGFSVTIQIKI